MQETEELDGARVTFANDRWERPGTESSGGYGITCVLEGGDLLEKVGGEGLGCRPAIRDVMFEPTRIMSSVS